ncbi:AAA family ATPase [uncultured Dysosmobacter sp.]|uniref:cytidylate kinase-like family protein n=1 Tax=uncultured Dysosmobacter sp. TaxID=2591384 RepID=UPI0026018408|nr:cytidylate kinase-like family protein [uncultured Dysosmobacter sp.]
MNKVITISREYGAGGHAIGKRVAQELGVEIYDKDIVRETVKASGYEPELVEQEGEDVTKTGSILKSICAGGAFFPDTQTAIHDVQSLVILQFAQAGPCVILGRCADEVLRAADIETLNVFIHADDLHRADRLSKMTGVTDPAELQRMLTKRDASRRAYYTHYTGKRWGDTHNYHLSLDSGALGDDLCVKLIVEAARA